MRWKQKKIHKKVINRTFFAFFPITVDGETRWLETVTIKGYWWLGKYSNIWWWESQSFVNP